ncbi:methyltransferase domain-containing protein [Actinomycetospora cinnamomea]|uniref:Methyltransferase family protein n=1 Tax=Actinomycetospora cinnamomea TaxID=663609 RepID=A0A2U1FM00_9PSEU|nr:methyltransferase domain-containing protein [Actinomycetospora cinnamomea]PVZ13207.1 methyltransferase family protein [Actinomycetospora cinnamomea]
MTAAPARAAAPGYALRLAPDELARYRMMAERAREHEADLWARAGLRPGTRVVDVGCGPGAMLLALARCVGPEGVVAGVDADPEAVATARAMLREAGLPGVAVCRARADATGLPEGAFDVGVMRHVLAHNGGAEQRLVAHLASLVRPGGHVYVLDVDATGAGTTPSLPAIDDLERRYQRWHADRGNDLRVGRRLAALARGAGLEVEDFRGWSQTASLPSGMRGPAWAARDALVAAGLADADDVARWDAAHAVVDGWERRPEVVIPVFAVVARRPSTPTNAAGP